MANSMPSWVLACGVLAGCGPTLQVGLASAPALGGDSPETRLHDVISNGHDACERSAFPAGEVLRGHTPPCNKESTLVTAPIRWTRAEPSRATSIPFLSYPVSTCPLVAGLGAPGLGVPFSSGGGCGEAQPTTAPADEREALELDDPFRPSSMMPHGGWRRATCGPSVSTPTFVAMRELVMLPPARNSESSMRLVDTSGVSLGCLRTQGFGE